MRLPIFMLLIVICVLSSTLAMKSKSGPVTHRISSLLKPFKKQPKPGHPPINRKPGSGRIKPSQIQKRPDGTLDRKPKPTIHPPKINHNPTAESDRHHNPKPGSAGNHTHFDTKKKSDSTQNHTRTQNTTKWPPSVGHSSTTENYHRNYSKPGSAGNHTHFDSEKKSGSTQNHTRTQNTTKWPPNVGHNHTTENNHRNYSKPGPAGNHTHFETKNQSSGTQNRLQNTTNWSPNVGHNHTTENYHRNYSKSGSAGNNTQLVTKKQTGGTQNSTQKTTISPKNNSYEDAKTINHFTFVYNPPQQIKFGSTYYPVYHGPPPEYVYKYRDSGSRYDDLLLGLALYNLGRMSANHRDPKKVYKGSPGEICKLGISAKNHRYQETRIDCRLISHVFLEADKKRSTQQATVATNTVTTTTVVNVTTNSNGTTIQNSTVITTVTVENKTVPDALKVKGPSIKVTAGMDCTLIRISIDSSILKKKVSCGVLKAYAKSSFRRNGVDRIIVPVTLLALFILVICLAS